MLLKLTVRDANQQVRGFARMKLFWGANKWFIQDDPQRVWSSVGFSQSGSFERKDWGVAWIWDRDSKGQKRNPLILWDAPHGEIDERRDAGLARIHDPSDIAFREGKISWSVEDRLVLSHRRRRVLELVDGILNHDYMDEKFDRATGKMRKNSDAVKAQEEWEYDSEGKPIPAMPGGTPENGGIKKKRKYTTCGSLPGYISKLMGCSDADSLNGTFRVRDQGLKYNAWVVPNGKNRPQPGDIYALLDKKDSGISHVGVITNVQGGHPLHEIWTTGDMGGGLDGWGGRKGTRRLYNKETVRLTGEIIQGGGDRKVAGWLNIDKYPFPSFPVHPRPLRQDAVR